MTVPNNLLSKLATALITALLITSVVPLLKVQARAPAVSTELGFWPQLGNVSVSLNDTYEELGWRDLKSIVVSDNSTHLFIRWEYYEHWPVANGSYSVSKALGFGIDTDDNAKTGFLGAEVVVSVFVWVTQSKEHSSSGNFTYEANYSYNLRVTFYSANGSETKELDIIYPDVNTTSSYAINVGDDYIEVVLPLDELNLTQGNIIRVIGRGFSSQCTSEDYVGIPADGTTLPLNRLTIYVDGFPDDWVGADITPIYDVDDNVTDYYWQYGNLTLFYFAANDTYFFIAANVSDTIPELLPDNAYLEIYFEIDTNADGFPDREVSVLLDNVTFVTNITVVYVNSTFYYYDYSDSVNYHYPDCLVRFNGGFIEAYINLSCLYLNASTLPDNITFYELKLRTYASDDPCIPPEVWLGFESPLIIYTVGEGGYVSRLVDYAQAGVVEHSGSYYLINFDSSVEGDVQIHAEANYISENYRAAIYAYSEEPTGNSTLPADMEAVSPYYLMLLGSASSIAWPVNITIYINSSSLILYDTSSITPFIYDAVSGAYEELPPDLWSTVSFEGLVEVDIQLTSDYYLAGDDPVLVIAAYPKTLTPAETVWVDDDWGGHAYGDIINADNLTLIYGVNATSSIIEALELVSDGGIVYVYPGFYDEGSLTVSKPVTIQGLYSDLADRPSVNATDVTIQADDVMLAGLNISESYCYVYAINADNLTIHSSLLAGEVHAIYESVSSLSQLNIINNLLLGGTLDIEFTNSSISKVIILNNTVQYAPYLGIGLYFENSSNADEVLINSCDLTGLSGDSYIGLTVSVDNESTVNKLLVTSCNISYFHYPGLGYGVVVSVSNESSIQNLTLQYLNLTYNNRGIYLEASNNSAITTTEITYCNIYPDYEYGLTINNVSGIVNASLNWWGDVSGPSGAGYGAGTQLLVYGSVSAIDYTPWLNAPAPQGQPINGSGASSTTTFSPSQNNLVDAKADTDMELVGDVNNEVNLTASFIKYEDNPVAEPTPNKGVKYVDVHLNIDNVTAVNTLEIRIYYTASEVSDETSLIPYWWDGSRCSAVTGA